MSSAPFNVLISSAGRRVELMKCFRGAIAELGLEGKVFAADASRFSAAFQSAERSFLVPKCTSPAFIPEVLRICRENGVRLVVPTIDTELEAYARSREAFEGQGIRVAISSPETVAIAANKDATHEWLVANGFPTVRQAPAGEVLANPEAWTFPLIAKPVAGSSSIGVSVVRDLAQLEANTRAGTYIVQSIAPGQEYTIDVLADRSGRCLCAVPRKRIEVRAGEVSKGATERSERLEQLAFALCGALPGAYGALNIQVFLDEVSGELNIIELNARFGGGFTLTWAAGGKYPTWIIEEILGRPCSASAAGWKGDVTMLRYDGAVYVEGIGA